ncbi:MAG TPA: sugar phosphate isomerase/epimerase [Desulfobulbus sp.]|nr:sugar phosphate isomerase/epimerase [Desulfobulbus sp.]
MIMIDNYPDITKKCFINAPFDRLQNELLELFTGNRIQPEIGLEGAWFWDCPFGNFEKIARIFQEQGLDCTLHAPFHDLAPGGFDKRIVALTREKLGRAFALIDLFRPRAIVCHLGFEENKHQAQFDRWLETSLSTWKPLVELAASSGTKVHFENTYEQGSVAHKRLLQELDAENVGFCLDTGHLMAFAGTGWRPWLKELGPWLGQLHLHDNDTTTDAHLALGAGSFDFFDLFGYLKENNLRPLVTLEPHSRQDLLHSLAYIDKTGLFDLLPK